MYPLIVLTMTNLTADGKVHGFDEAIKLGLYDGKVTGTILGNVYGITLEIVLEQIWVP